MGIIKTFPATLNVEEANSNMTNLLCSANYLQQCHTLQPDGGPVMYSFGGSEGQVIAHEAEQVRCARSLVRAQRELRPRYMFLRGA